MLSINPTQISSEQRQNECIIYTVLYRHECLIRISLIEESLNKQESQIIPRSTCFSFPNIQVLYYLLRTRSLRMLI